MNELDLCPGCEGYEEESDGCDNEFHHRRAIAAARAEGYRAGIEAAIKAAKGAVVKDYTDHYYAGAMEVVRAVEAIAPAKEEPK